MKKYFSFIMLALCCWLGETQADARPRYYVRVLGASEATPACGLASQAKADLIAALKRSDAITLELKPSGLKGKKLQRLLKRKRLIGYQVNLRVMRCKHELTPPKKGKQYKMLMVNVAVALDAQHIPQGTMAVAGKGDAHVGYEVSRIKQSELKSLRREALKQAIDHAVEEFAKPKRRGRSRARRRKSRRK